MTKTLALLVPVILLGCQSHDKTTITETTETRTTHTAPAPVSTLDDRALDQLVTNVVSAPSPHAEADAIRALRKYETDHGLTYNVRTFNTDTNVPIASPTVASGPVRVEVNVFRGRDPLRNFSFIPRDNRNLALFGE